MACFLLLKTSAIIFIIDLVKKNYGKNQFLEIVYLSTR